jgi:hypothetical protein
LSLPLPSKFNDLESQTLDICKFTLTRSGGRFELAIGEQLFKQTTCEFMLTFASMQGKNMDEYMSNLGNEYDRVRVPLSGCGKSVVVSLADFVKLRTIYGQCMFELRLQDLLMRQGISVQNFVTSER